MEIRQYIIDSVIAMTGLQPDVILKSQNIFELGMDSFGFIQLISDIETNYNVSFEPDDLMTEGFRSVEGIIEAVEQKRSQNG